MLIGCPHTYPNGDPTRNLSMCLDQGLNPQLLGHGMTLQPTEPQGQDWEALFYRLCLLAVILAER